MFSQPRIRCFSTLLILALCGFGQPTNKRRIAIMDFDASAVKTAVARDLGPGYDIGKTVSQSLLSPLIESGAYEVLDRARMQVLFKEQNAKFSDRFDSSQAVSYGRVLNADAIVTGVVNSVLIEVKKKTKGLAGVGRRVTVVHAAVDITAQVISTETSQIYAAPNSTGEAEEELASEISGSFHIPGTRQPQQSGGNGSQTVRSNIAEPTVQKAIRQAVQKIAKEMVDKAPNLPHRSATPLDKAMKYSTKGSATATALNGTVVDIEGKVAFIDAGTEAGVQKGERLAVRRFLRNATSKGKTIRLDRKIGAIDITEVQQGWSSGTFSGSEPLQKGDKVVREQ